MLINKAGIRMTYKRFVEAYVETEIHRVYVNTCICVCRFMQLNHVSQYACMYACAYVGTYVCTLVGVYVYMYVSMYVCMHACMFVFLYVGR